MKELTEFELIKSIKKVNGVTVKGKTIVVCKDNHGAGLKTWNKIEVLKKSFGYFVAFDDNSRNSSNNTYDDDNTNNIKNNKVKFNIKLQKINFKKL